MQESERQTVTAQAYDAVIVGAGSIGALLVRMLQHTLTPIDENTLAELSPYRDFGQQGQEASVNLVCFCPAAAERVSHPSAWPPRSLRAQSSRPERPRYPPRWSDPNQARQQSAAVPADG